MDMKALPTNFQMYLSISDQLTGMMLKCCLAAVLTLNVKLEVKLCNTQQIYSKLFTHYTSDLHSL